MSDGTTSSGGEFSASFHAPSASKRFSAPHVLAPCRFGVCGQRNIRLLQQRRHPERDPQEPAAVTGASNHLLLLASSFLTTIRHYFNQLIQTEAFRHIPGGLLLILIND